MAIAGVTSAYLIVILITDLSILQIQSEEAVSDHE